MEPTSGTGATDPDGGDRPTSAHVAPRRPRRRAAIGLAVAVLVLVGGVGLWWLRRDTSREVTVEEAAARTSAAADDETSTGDGPAPGVYRYDGEGTSSLSVPPLSQEQGPSMPGTVELTDDGCWSFRVDYSTNHWQSWSYCSTDDGVVEEGGQSWQRWVIGPTSITNLTVSTCDRALVLPDERDVGDERRERCTSANEAVDGEVISEGPFRYVGDEDLDVGGTQVRTAHFVREREMSGAQSGTERTEVWFEVGTGLPVRNERELEVRTDTPAGPSTYREDGWFQLASTEPT